MSAYIGCILEIDLSTRTIEKTRVRRDILRKYIGGSGLASKLFLERGNVHAEPLSKDNGLYIMTGPLTGTRFPGTGRFSCAAKSPLTGIWGESNCGGNFGPELKFAGYDGIIITGAAPKPVYVLIEDDDIRICDASGLWGLDNYQVAGFFKTGEGAASGKRKYKVLSIGPAGENLVRYATIMNGEADAFGRCGMGAVMGSKKLKSIVVRGPGGPWKPQEDGEYGRFIKSVLKKIKAHPFARSLHRLGTNAGMVKGRKMGDIPTKNWSLGECGEFSRPLLPYYMMDEKYFVRHKACFSCPVACKKEVAVKEGVYREEQGPAPEYEAFCSLGTMLLINDLEAVIKLNNICNRYGLDVISCGSTMAFAVECFEKGLISKEDTGGVELGWGDPDTVIDLLRKTAYREGFGDLLAEGTRIAAAKIGKGAADLKVEVKGLELPMHDPRAFHGQGMAYATSARGGCHVSNLVHFVEPNTSSHPELGLQETYDDRFACEGKAEMTVICEDWGMVLNAATMCQFVFGNLSGEDLVFMLKKATGFDYDLEEVRRCGERLWYMKRILNNIMGVRAPDDQLPKRLMAPFTEGGAAGKVPDMEFMLKEYYQLRDLDGNGIPRRGRLKGLALLDLVKKEYNRVVGEDTGSA